MSIRLAVSLTLLPILAGAAPPPIPRLDLDETPPTALDVPVTGSEAQIDVRTSRLRTIWSNSQPMDLKVFVRRNVDSGGIRQSFDLREGLAIQSDSRLVFSGVQPNDRVALWVGGADSKDEVLIAIRFVESAATPASEKPVPESKQGVSDKSSIWVPVVLTLAVLLGLSGLAAAAFAFIQVRNAQDEIRELRQMAGKKRETRNTDGDLTSAVRDLSDRLEALEQRPQSSPLAADSLGLIRQQLDGLGQRISSQDRSLEKLAEAAAKNLEGPLKILVDGALADKLNESASDFFRRAVPERDGLDERLQGGQELGSAIDGFVTAVATNRPELRHALQPVRQEVALLEDEVEQLIRAPREQTLKLNFQVIFSTSPASRETVAEALAGGLRREILKLAEPLPYFDRRLHSIGLRAAQTAVEYMDRSADPARKNEAFQSAFGALIGAAGLIAILPREGDSYSPEEHQVEQTQQSPDLARSHTVARVFVRGLRQNGRVVRKATICLYQ